MRERERKREREKKDRERKREELIRTPCNPDLLGVPHLISPRLGPSVTTFA